MSSKNPTTYFDYWFKASNDAANDLSEQYEQELSPVLSELMRDLFPMQELPASTERMLNLMMNPPHPAWSEIMKEVVGSVGNSATSSVLTHATRLFNYAAGKRFKSLHIDANTAIALFSRKRIQEGLYNERMVETGFNEIEAAFAYEATKPFPSIPDIMDYVRHTGSYNNLFGDVSKLYDISEIDFPMWAFISGIHLTGNDIQQLFARGIISENTFDEQMQRAGYEFSNLEYMKQLSYSLPDINVLIQDGLFNGVNEQEIIERIERVGVNPDNAPKYITALTTKPDITSIIEFLLRTDNTLSALPNELRKIGVNDNYFDMYRQLANVIPPVQDIITMAVREAFSPAIASRFGQYEDFPEDFAKYAAMKGLSKEWAERYWAAHWGLPSPQQGFEMLHRGIITQEDLNLLLKALDIMPFWRDKLVKMAYTTYTRVDIRRMYGIGVLTAADVKKAYLENGYDEIKAEQLTKFTVAEHAASITGLKSQNVVTAYANGLINQSELTGILSDMGLKYEEIAQITKAANYKKQWEIKTLKISAISNQYKKKAITRNEANSQLLSLGIAAGEVNLMLDKWEYSEPEDKPTLWTAAQTLALYKKGLINISRANLELVGLGYDNEHREKLLAGSAPAA